MRDFGRFLKRLFAVTFIASFLMQATALPQASSSKGESSAAAMPPPQYQIFDIGVVQTGDTASQGFGASTGGIAVGRSIRTGGAQAFTWSRGGGIMGLPNLAGRAFCVSNGANNGGGVVGTCATTLTGTGRLPVIWQNGAVSQLPLPAGQTLGDANDVNASGVAVGSAGSGGTQRGIVYSGGNATQITQTTSNGSFFVTAFGINDSGRVVGQGIDPANAARNVGMVYDIGSSSAFEVGALPNANGALAFGVGNAGHVVGASMQNQGAGLPFIWTQAGGMTAIPLPAGTTQGSARAVNSAGWAVGTGGGQFAVPFLYDGTATYRLADLIPAGTGWDLSTNTSSSALGISDNNIIVGTGVLNGQIRAYAMVPANRPAILDFNGDGKTDYAVSRGNAPNQQSTWYINYNGSAANVSQTAPFGLGVSRYVDPISTRDIAVPADYDGDGKTDVAVFRPSGYGDPNRGFFFILQSNTGTFRAEQFGSQRDDPSVIGDYDGDGKADVAVFRRPFTETSNPGCGATGAAWYYRPSGSPSTDFRFVCWGTSGDFPAPGDYDGDGKADFVVHRIVNGNGIYYLNQSSGVIDYAYWGSQAPESIAPGDYDGDGKTDFALVRSGAGGIPLVWYIMERDGGFQYHTYGRSGTDFITPGDYDGDGKTDISVWRGSVTPGASAFFVRPANTSGERDIVFPWGISSDFPLAVYNVH